MNTRPAGRSQSIRPEQQQRTRGRWLECADHASITGALRQQPRVVAAHAPQRSRVLRAPVAPAVAPLPVDRLRRQPGAGQRDRRPAARRTLRPPQRRQRGGAERPQLPVRDAVRGRRAQGGAHHRVRPLRVQRGERGAREPPRGPRGQLAAPRAGRPSQARGARRCRDAHGATHRPPVRAQRDRAGRQRLPDHDRGRRLGPRPAAVRARLGIRARGRTRARPPDDRDGAGRGRPSRYKAALAAL